MRAYFGTNAARLSRIQSKYDAAGVFAGTHTVRPGYAP